MPLFSSEIIKSAHWHKLTCHITFNVAFGHQLTLKVHKYKVSKTPLREELAFVTEPCVAPKELDRAQPCGLLNTSQVEYTQLHVY